MVSLVLEPLHLVWTIHDERLLVTTPEIRYDRLITKVYPVQDLVGRSRAGNPFTNNAAAALIDTIRKALAPLAGKIMVVGHRILAPARSLVISQTFAKHRGIASLARVAAKSTQRPEHPFQRSTPRATPLALRGRAGRIVGRVDAADHRPAEAQQAAEDRIRTRARKTSGRKDQF